MLQSLLGAGSGILTGLFGTGLQALFKWLGDKQRFAHDLAMRKMDIEAMTAEHALRLKETEAEYAGRVQVAKVDLDKEEARADADIRSASYGNDKATYYDTKAKGWVGIMLALVDAFRGFMRPGLTAYLVVCTTIIAYMLHEVVANSVAMSPEEIYKQVVMSILFLTETAVTWWFGSRALQRKAV